MNRCYMIEVYSRQGEEDIIHVHEVDKSYSADVLYSHNPNSPSLICSIHGADSDFFQRLALLVGRPAATDSDESWQASEAILRTTDAKNR